MFSRPSIPEESALGKAMLHGIALNTVKDILERWRLRASTSLRSATFQEQRNVDIVRLYRYVLREEQARLMSESEIDCRVWTDTGRKRVGGSKGRGGCSCSRGKSD